MSKKQYRKLPGKAVQLINCSNLYLGPDHLLKVTRMFFVEEYKRFYYPDIQAVIVRKTPRYYWCASGLGLPTMALLLLGLLAVSRGTPAGNSVGMVLLISATFIGTALLIHLLLGPTCHVVLKTAVHSEQLPSLSRIRTARMVIARLVAEVENAQRENLNAETEAAGTSPEVQSTPMTSEHQI